MAEVGYASLGIIPSFKGFESKLNSGTSGVMSKVGIASGTKFGDAAGKQAGSRFGGAFKTAAKASLIGLGALGVGAIKLAGDSVKAASDLEESTNKVSQVFGKGAESVFQFSEKAADALGQTNQQARDAAATFGMLGKGAGFADKKNAKFSKQMTKLASDLASFSNTSPDEAIDALGSALRGESEPIRKYGVLLDEATLKAEAMSIGILKPVKDRAKIESYQARILEGQQKYNDAVAEYGPKSIEAIKAQAALGTAQAGLKKATEGSIPPLTQQQKVLAAQSSIFKQTKDAQGDFARTSDGLANQQRRLSARFEDAKAKLGKGLLPIMTQAADFLLDKGIPAFEDFADWFNKKGIPAIKGFADEVKPIAGDVKDFVGYLNDLPKPAKIAGVTALFTAIAGAKLRGGALGGKGGLLGSVGKAVGIAKPVPVFVTNPGIGGLGGATGPTSKLGKAAAFASKAAVPVAIVAASGIALKEFYDFNHKDDKSVVEHAITGGSMGDLSRQFFDWLSGSDDKVKTYSKTIGEVNNAWAKVRTSTEEARGEVRLYGSDVKLVPSKWLTTFEAVNLARDKMLVQEYGSLLDGLNGRTVRTYFESVQLNKPGDVGEGTPGQPPNRSGPRVVINHNGDIKSDSPRDYARNMQRRARVVNGGGVDW